MFTKSCKSECFLTKRLDVCSSVDQDEGWRAARCKSKVKGIGHMSPGEKVVKYKLGQMSYSTPGGQVVNYKIGSKSDVKFKNQCHMS